MASGTYGIVRPADITPDDVEIFYHYTPSRDKIGKDNKNELSRLDPNDVLIRMENPNKPSTSGPELFGGMYTLKLPVDKFGVKGIYTIIIKPVEIRTKIVDVGVLSTFPDTKGLIFDLGSQTISQNLLNRFENNGLVGYRVEYLNTTTSSDAKISNFFRIITSNNRAEPVQQNLQNSNQKAIRYRLNDNSTLVFCTVTPSSASNVRPNAFPFIGQPNQDVIITNTYFNPIMLEVEMVNHDVETLAYAMFGNQTKSLEDGIYTIYNFNNDIYKQYDLYEIKDQFTGTPLFEVREERTSVDFSKTFDDIKTI
jgi:predicted transcriptional regulator YdeE